LRQLQLAPKSISVSAYSKGVTMPSAWTSSSSVVKKRFEGGAVEGAQRGQGKLQQRQARGGIEPLRAERWAGQRQAATWGLGPACWATRPVARRRAALSPLSSKP